MKDYKFELGLIGFGLFSLFAPYASSGQAAFQCLVITGIGLGCLVSKYDKLHGNK